MKKAHLLAAVALAALGAAACDERQSGVLEDTDTDSTAVTTPENTTSGTTADEDVTTGVIDEAAASDATAFVTNAALGNMFEVESSRLAQTRTQNADLRSFADRMIADHTKAGDELESLVSGGNVEGVMASEIPTQLDADHAVKLEQLRTASTDDFDDLYRDMQIEAHEAVVSLFDEQSENGSDPDLMTWTANTLPTLRDHLSAIQAIDLADSEPEAGGMEIMQDDTNQGADEGQSPD